LWLTEPGKIGGSRRRDVIREPELTPPGNSAATGEPSWVNMLLAPAVHVESVNSVYHD
jgi:hypothetical protein